ncbi:MAG: EVE domain-containing protein [Candidatus Caldarchaeum sp.]
MAKRYWLFKSEPSCYSFEALCKEQGKKACWDGVRNYQARNFLRDEIRKGDGVLFYHSSCQEPGVVGIAEVVSDPYPDPTQFDPGSEYYDSLSTRAKPRWWSVDIRAVRPLKKPVSLKLMKEAPGLEGMWILRKGNRLSITPVTHEEGEIILRLGGG